MVSVIVPVYNVEEYLPRCIESICGQTLSDLEIILVDDGSTDRSGLICDEYAQEDTRIIVIHKENGGLVSARQAGLKVASGSYIGYVDSDDWIDNIMYEDMLSICEREGADIATSIFYYEFGSRTNKEACLIPEGVYKATDGSKKKLICNLLYAEDGMDTLAPNLCSKLFRRELLCKYQFKVDPRITYGEDAACTYPCLADADCVAVTHKTYYHYCIRGNSICKTTDERYFERITVLYQNLKTSFLNHPASIILIEQLNYYMLRLVLTGVNKLFGFGLGIVVPAYLLPGGLRQRIINKKIILYGAGTVGQSYNRLFQFTKAAKVVGWIDRDWEKYRKIGLPVQSITELKELEYDGILIAVNESGTAQAIRENLLGHGVSENKIWYEPPQTLLHALDKGRLLW